MTKSVLKFFFGFFLTIIIITLKPFINIRVGKYPDRLGPFVVIPDIWINKKKCTETLLNYEYIPIEYSAQQISEQLSTILVDHIETLEPTYAWSVMAHALFSALKHLNGKLNSNRLSRLTEEDLKTLKQYEQKFLKVMEQRK